MPGKRSKTAPEVDHRHIRHAGKTKHHDNKRFSSPTMKQRSKQSTKDWLAWNRKLSQIWITSFNYNTGLKIKQLESLPRYSRRFATK